MMTIRCDVGIHSLCDNAECDCGCHQGDPVDKLTPAQRACAVLLAVAVAAGGLLDHGAL